MSDNVPGIEKDRMLPSSVQIGFDEGSADLPTKDEEYWIQGEFIVFQVENILFRVPSFQFTQNSVVFESMFNLPQREEKGVDYHEGSSSKKPIILPTTITAIDFRSFLKALYPQKHIIGSKTIPPGLSQQELTSILKLSTMWYFLDHRVQAIDYLLPSLSHIEQITVGREYRSHKLLLAGFEGLVKRTAQIDDAEAMLIEPMTAVRLYRVREKYRIHQSRYVNMSAFLHERLGPELESIKQEELGYTVTST